jgi:hypothetical protein
VVEQSLDRVAFRLITTDGRDCDDEWFRSTENESCEVAMALAGAIAGFRVIEFVGLSVWTAMVVNIDEVEADDPRAGAEDHRRLLSENIVDGGFEVIRWNGVQLFEGVIVRVSATSGVCGGFDRFPIDSGLEKRLTNDSGVEGCGFDSGDWKLCEKSFR